MVWPFPTFGTPRRSTGTIRRSPRHPDTTGLAACTAEPFRVRAKEGARLGMTAAIPTFPTGAPILEFCRRKLNLFKGR
jgi:hypothetical protein